MSPNEIAVLRIVRGYGLSQKGKNVFLTLFYEDKGRMGVRIKRLRQLSNEVSQKIENLEENL